MPPTKKIKAGAEKAIKSVTTINVLKAVPKFGVDFPFSYNGCNVYRSAARYRVVPRPGKSVYDKAFQFGGMKTEKEAFADMLQYLKNPTIPKTSANYVP